MHIGSREHGRTHLLLLVALLGRFLPLARLAERARVVGLAGAQLHRERVVLHLGSLARCGGFRHRGEDERWRARRGAAPPRPASRSELAASHQFPAARSRFLSLAGTHRQSLRRLDCVRNLRSARIDQTLQDVEPVPVRLQVDKLRRTSCSASSCASAEEKLPTRAIDGDGRRAEQAVVGREADDAHSLRRGRVERDDLVAAGDVEALVRDTWVIERRGTRGEREEEDARVDPAREVPVHERLEALGGKDGPHRVEAREDEGEERLGPEERQRGAVPLVVQLDEFVDRGGRARVARVDAAACTWVGVSVCSRTCCSRKRRRRTHR